MLTGASIDAAVGDPAGRGGSADGLESARRQQELEGRWEDTDRFRCLQVERALRGRVGKSSGRTMQTESLADAVPRQPNVRRLLARVL
jgi:hypothetical protein